MASRFEPLSEIPASWVVDYFGRKGVPEALVRWKFFDVEAPSQHRNRGVAWVRDDRVQGFLGLIPCTLGCGDDRYPMSWTCDWSLEERTAAPGVGVRMLQHVLRANEPVFSARRGTDFTASIAPRVGHHTIDDAVRAYVCPLRASRVLNHIPRLGAALARAPGIADIPLPVVRVASSDVAVEPGVSPRLESVLDGPRGPGWFPAYDAAFLKWIIGRCPVLECATVLTPAHGEARAAALLWRKRDERRCWRAALFARPGAPEFATAVSQVAAAAAREARREGGEALIMMLSRLDGDLVSAAHTALRLFERPPEPLYVLVSRNPEVDELGRLSYLDADLQYIF